MGHTWGMLAKKCTGDEFAGADRVDPALAVVVAESAA